MKPKSNYIRKLVVTFVKQAAARERAHRLMLREKARERREELAKRPRVFVKHLPPRVLASEEETERLIAVGEWK